MFWSYISLKFLTYNCFIFLICNYFKKYLITYVRICKCKDFKILKSVNELINKGGGGVDQESFWNRIMTPRIGIGSDREVTKDSHP